VTEYKDVIVIGGGLTGLAAARVLAKNSVNYIVVEKDSDVGGRMRSEMFEGCVLDQGFQVILPAYPSIKALKLSVPLMPFSRAATCITPNGQFVVADPLHHPGQFMANFGRTPATIWDSFRMLRHMKARRFDLSTEQLFENLGYSESFKNSFLRPFLRGVLLDPTLDCPSPLSSYFLERFFLGGASLVKGGIQQFPRDLAKNLSICCNTEVEAISNAEIRTSDGRMYSAKTVVDTRPNAMGKEVTWLGTHCHYFLSTIPVNLDRRIVLCSADGPTSINLVSNLSEVDPSYSPVGTSLLSVTQIQAELLSILGLPSSQVSHLKSVEVKQALPLTTNLSPNFPEPSAPQQIGNAIYASDTLSYGSQQASLRMGEKAGQMAISTLRI
jgi:hypothetical protein